MYTRKLTSAFVALTTIIECICGQALSGSFDILSYNVAGLPGMLFPHSKPLSSSDPVNNTPLISPRIGNYSIVHVQEDFNYHDILYKDDKHPQRTTTSGGVPVGSGLNTLANFPWTDLQRETWDACWFNSGDCLTPKGFTAMRMQITDGVTIDLYNLHAEAGDDTLDFAARTVGFKQLANFISTYSAGNAVILAGDTNCRYTSAKDPIRLLTSGSPSLTDVWVALEKAGTPPTAGTTSIECPFPVAAGQEDNACEQIDKVLYRSSPLVTLTPTDFINANAAFLRPDGGPLSDHFPIAVPFDWQLAAALRASPRILGGRQGDFFNDLQSYAGAATDATARATVREIAFRGGDRLDQVSYVLTDGTAVAHGGTAGSATDKMSLEEDERVTEVVVCEGQRTGGETGVFYVKVTTSKDRTLQAGRETASCETWKAPGEDWTLVGFQGWVRPEVEALGVVWGKV
ncbi:Endonuclease/exonuclease/phosphatase [Geopyxis carbonaria]|nr:Endonuclease/exonuclease/phosphatase [Geopyxis carbonaria]